MRTENRMCEIWFAPCGLVLCERLHGVMCWIIARTRRFLRSVVPTGCGSGSLSSSGTPVRVWSMGDWVTVGRWGLGTGSRRMGGWRWTYPSAPQARIPPEAAGVAEVGAEIDVAI